MSRNQARCNSPASQGNVISPVCNLQNPKSLLTVYETQSANSCSARFLIGGLPLLASAQINLGIGINVREAPPRPREEVIVAAPGPDYVWIAGHWGWHGHWVWESGRWDRHPGSTWIGGHWDHREGGYVWVEGRWAPYAEPARVGGYVVVQEAPPPVIVEHYGRPPGPDYAWVNGRWDWHGGWVWSPAATGIATRTGAPRRRGWIAGHWDHRSNGYVWVEGRWN